MFFIKTDSSPFDSYLDSASSLDKSESVRRSQTAFLLRVVGVLVLLAAIAPFDERIAGWISSHAVHRSAPRIAMNLAALAFSWMVYVLIGGLLLTRKDRTRVFGSYLALVLGCIGSLHALKFFFGRARPELGLGAYWFDWFGNPMAKFDSFPSGHATSIVLITLLLSLYCPRSRWIMVPLAVLACLQRVAVERHYLTDVIAGACLAALWVVVMQAVLGRAAFPKLSFDRSSLCLFWRKNNQPAAEAA